MDPVQEKKYISVILPLKYRGGATYTLPQEMAGDVVVGSRVGVDFAGKRYQAVVESINSEPVGGHISDPSQTIIYKDILSVEPYPPVSHNEIELWRQVADYYMCSIGEVYKAAYPAMAIRQEGVKSRKGVAEFLKAVELQGNSYDLPQLSPKQIEVMDSIESSFAAGSKPILLHGVTGSGKTEIYINMAVRRLLQGKSVLYMAPEIAITKQLQLRLKKVFGERLLVFHSKQTAGEKKRIHKIVSGQAEGENIEGNGGERKGVVVLGTRSALFLPFSNLGLVIVDEEHDSSYKQSEPAPRYQARDVAVMVANIHKANILLGSATPSLESLYNCMIGRFDKVLLQEKYYGAVGAQVGIIDTIWARKSGQMRGNFSQKLINAIKKRVEEGKQVLIFKNRRSYSPVVECVECGETLKCPHCNVNLSYHRYNSTLRCHYCDYTTTFNSICPHCGLDSLKYKGSGTERLEEELKELVPQARIARFDADIASSKRAEEAVIKAFSAGEIDILVGTQMLSKGFDFSNLKLVAVIDADSLLAMQDFRADERAMQIFSQLLGRSGRRDEPGELLLQTNRKEHPVIRTLASSDYFYDTLLEQRKEFGFTPFVRMVKITVKHSNQEKLKLIVQMVEDILGKVDCLEFTGPFVPPIDKVRGEWLNAFYVKFARNRSLQQNKKSLLEKILALKCGNAIIIDVDPL